MCEEVVCYLYLQEQSKCCITKLNKVRQGELMFTFHEAFFSKLTVVELVIQNFKLLPNQIKYYVVFISCLCSIPITSDPFHKVVLVLIQVALCLWSSFLNFRHVIVIIQLR